MLRILLTNAGGQIRLTVEPDVHKARIIVRDSGVGISDDVLPHIFKMFTQAPQTLERKLGGLGLGLPVVKHLVELHEGQVSAASPGLGQGSEFIVTLPRLLEGEPIARRASEPATSKARKLLPLRIMVVDDEQETAKIFADILELDGYETLAVNDGPTALLAARGFSPDVILVDLGLPEMDGYEVVTRLREEHGDKKILMIAVTGY